MNEEEQENIILIQCRKKRQNIEQINTPGVPPPCLTACHPMLGSDNSWTRSSLWRSAALCTESVKWKEPGDQGRVCCCVAGGQWASVDNWADCPGEKKKILHHHLWFTMTLTHKPLEYQLSLHLWETEDFWSEPSWPFALPKAAIVQSWFNKYNQTRQAQSSLACLSQSHNTTAKLWWIDLTVCQFVSALWLWKGQRISLAENCRAQYSCFF